MNALCYSIRRDAESLPMEDSNLGRMLSRRHSENINESKGSTALLLFRYSLTDSELQLRLGSPHFLAAVTGLPYACWYALTWPGWNV